MCEPGVHLDAKEPRYAERWQMSFDGTSHLNIVADPANHSRRSTTVGIAWSWEPAAGAVCDVQQMPACSTLTLYEDELGAAAPHLREIRLERISTYRCHIAVLSDKLGHSVHRPGRGYTREFLVFKVREMSNRRQLQALSGMISGLGIQAGWLQACTDASVPADFGLGSADSNPRTRWPPS